MVQAVRIQSWFDRGNLVNLEDLRSQLTGRLAILLICISGFAMWWLTLRQGSFLLAEFILFSLLVGLGIGVQILGKVYPVLARHLLVWGLTLGLLLGMHLFANPWLPFLGLLLTFISAMLIMGSELIVALIIAVLAARLASLGSRNYPLPDLFVMLALGVAVTWLAVHTLYTALRWTRNMQRRTDQLLAEVRDHRAELSRALKSSDLANTLLRRTQRELITARKQAEAARRMKERFAVNISHELRTPLNLILGFSEVMHLSPDVYGVLPWPPILRRDVYHIYRASRHLLALIDDVLDLSRFEMAGFTLNKEATALDSLLQDTITIAADLFRGHPVDLALTLAPELPVLEIDRTRIRQVLLNLLTNAQRFTAEGRVQVEARQVRGEVVISVRDTGPGIPADKLPHLFDEFYQVDLSLHRSHQGAGLGLAISKRFVQAHGGSIWVESQLGLGSTFFFSLPVSGAYLEPLPANGAGRPESPVVEKAARILVVDPDSAVITLVRRHLEKCEVLQLENLDHLPDALADYHPRMVINNVPPNRQPGYKDIPNIPIPYVECSLPSQAWLADELAVAACLTKPVTIGQLLSEIDRLDPVEDILIIDDERGFGQLIERMLVAAGRSFKIRHAYEGQDGLSAMAQQPPDLVLLDLIMAGVDGFQVLEQMKREAGLTHIPVILLTATSYAEDALASRAGHMAICRSDGLRPAEILSCLRAIIEILEPHYDEKTIPEEIRDHSG